MVGDFLILFYTFSHFITCENAHYRRKKLDGLSYEELKRNIGNTIKTIPKEKYRNILKGAYERPERYVSKKNKTRKIKKNYL
jgi:hypothetical protein